MIGQSDLDNRFRYHAPVGDQLHTYAKVCDKAKQVAEFYNEVCPDSREKSLAITHLEDAVMWANAAIARHEL